MQKKNNNNSNKDTILYKTDVPCRKSLQSTFTLEKKSPFRCGL